MAFALGQQPQMTDQHLQRKQRQRPIDDSRRAQVDRLDREHTELVVEPRPPGRRDPIAGLQDGGQALRPAAADNAELAAPLGGHEFQDGAGLTEAADTEHDALIAPLHRRVRPALSRPADAPGSSHLVMDRGCHQLRHSRTQQGGGRKAKPKSKRPGVSAGPFPFP